jgi:hypothetical protein
MSSEKTSSGKVVLARGTPFNGVKVFSATMFAARERLGETVTDWIASHPECAITEMAVTQSSDNEFHCVTISVFYAEANARR